MITTRGTRTLTSPPPGARAADCSNPTVKLSDLTLAVEPPLSLVTVKHSGRVPGRPLSFELYSKLSVDVPP